MKKPTIADVAEKAGVSKPTVSRYLKQENVKPQIAEKIQAAIDELGYVPKGASVKEETLFNAPEKKEPVKKEEAKKPKAKAKKIVEKKGYKLALLTKDLSDYRTRTMLKYLQQSLSEAGCMLQIVMTEGKEELEEQYLTTFIVQNVNGILIESCSSAEFIMKQLRTTAIPYVFLRSHIEGNDVAMDEVHAANLLAKYLLDKQHLIIRYLGSDEELTKDHLEGIRNAYHALKQPIDIIPVVSDGTYDDLFEKIKDLFKEKIDLLILQSDEMAIPVNKYLKEYHISVPQNVSMVCFGGTSITNVMSPAITSLQYDYEAYTAYVCQCLFAMIEKKMLPEKKPFYRVEEKDSVR